jgi:hypothetical protein
MEGRQDRFHGNDRELVCGAHPTFFAGMNKVVLRGVFDPQRSWGLNNKDSACGGQVGGARHLIDY